MFNNFAQSLVFIFIFLYGSNALSQSQLQKYEIVPYFQNEAVDAATGAKSVISFALRVDRVTGSFKQCIGEFLITSFQQNPAKPAVSVSCKQEGFAVGVSGLKSKAVVVPTVTSYAQNSLDVLWLIDVNTGSVQFCHQKPGCTQALQIP